MATDDVFSADMPAQPSRPIAPLDADTAERLLSGRLDPDDAPPGYAEVARLFQTAAGPADEVELAGETAALAAFRMAQPPAQPVHRASEAPGRPGAALGLRGGAGRPTGRRGGVRGRLAALALAGAVAVAGVGVWTAGGAPFSRELRSPSGGPNAGGPGSGTPASAVYGSSAGGAGPLRTAGPGVRSTTGTPDVTDRSPPSLPSARERATARHRGGPTSRADGSPHGAKPSSPRQAKPEPPTPTPPKAQKPDRDAPKAKPPKASRSWTRSRPSPRSGQLGADGRQPGADDGHQQADPAAAQQEQ